MPLAMTRSSPPRLASLGVLLWAATSSAMPIDTSIRTPNDADGPAAHELSLQPDGHGAYLDLEKLGPKTCKGSDCCNIYIPFTDSYLAKSMKRCEDITYSYAGSNCHQYFYWNGAPCPPPCPPTRVHARALRRAHADVSYAMPRRGQDAQPTVPEPGLEAWLVWKEGRVQSVQIDCAHRARLRQRKGLADSR